MGLITLIKTPLRTVGKQEQPLFGGAEKENFQNARKEGGEGREGGEGGGQVKSARGRIHVRIATGPSSSSSRGAHAHIMRMHVASVAMMRMTFCTTIATSSNRVHL